MNEHRHELTEDEAKSHQAQLDKHAEGEKKKEEKPKEDKKKK